MADVEPFTQVQELVIVRLLTDSHAVKFRTRA